MTSALCCRSSLVHILQQEERKKMPERVEDLQTEHEDRSGAHKGLPDIWELKGEYYQVLGHAWDHEVKDFKVIYRPLYHCTAKPDRFQAHYMAASHFSRWESKFNKVLLSTWEDFETFIPPEVRKLVLPGPFWVDPEWTKENGFAERTKERSREMKSRGEIDSTNEDKCTLGTRTHEMKDFHVDT